MGHLGGKRSGEWTKSRKDKTEKAAGLGRKNKRGDVENWDQTAALGFQTGGRHHKSPASLQGQREREREIWGK